MNKGSLRIRIVIALSLGFVLTSAHAGTNSWTYAGANPATYHWEVNTSWALGRPSLNDNFDFITNSTTKTVTLNADTVSVWPGSLTITNLTVASPGNTTNTLFLNSAGTNVPLRIFKGLTVGSGGVLQITNSFLEVDITNGLFHIDGTLRTYGGAKVESRTITVGSGAVLEFALGTNSSPIVVSNDLTVAGTLNITDGEGFTATTYTLFTYGGSLTDNGLTVGTMPTNFTAALDYSTVGEVNLVVSGGAGGGSSTLQITSIAQQSNDILITWTTTGAGTTNAVQITSGAADGSYATNDFADASGNIFISTTTTNYLDTGGATNFPSRYYRVRLVP